MNPNISTYAHVYRLLYYTVAPFVQIGMETFVRNKPKRRGAFAEHYSNGFVLGSSFEHYALRIIWIKDIRATRILTTVFLKHKYITNPDITPKNQLIAAAGNFDDKRKGHMPHHLSETTLKQLERIRTILKQGCT